MNLLSDKDKIIKVQAELIKSLQKQIKELEESKILITERHNKRREKIKTDLAISKNENTLRLNTTRKPKK